MSASPSPPASPGRRQPESDPDEPCSDHLLTELRALESMLQPGRDASAPDDGTEAGAKAPAPDG